MSAAKATKPKPPVTVTMDAKDLLRGLHNARLFAGVDVTLPVLRAIQIEGSSSGLTFVATDRYRIGVTTIPMKIKTFTFLLDLDDAALIGKLFNAKSGPLSLTFSEDKLTVQPAEGMVAGPQVVITCTAVDGTFPKYQSLFDVQPSDEKPAYNTGDEIGMNPRYLAAFGRVKSDLSPHDSPIRVRVVSPLLPVFIDIGEQFRGLLMPVRLSELNARRARVESKSAAA